MIPKYNSSCTELSEKNLFLENYLSNELELVHIRMFILHWNVTTLFWLLSKWKKKSLEPSSTQTRTIKTKIQIHVCSCESIKFQYHNLTLNHFELIYLQAPKSVPLIWNAPITRDSLQTKNTVTPKVKHKIKHHKPTQQTTHHRHTLYQTNTPLAAFSAPFLSTHLNNHDFYACGKNYCFFMCWT